LNEEHLNIEQRQQQLTKILHRSIDLLARREHSAKELTDKLIQKGFDIELVSLTIERLQQEKLQSDLRFTESFVNERKRRGHGPIKISHQLHQKGVASEIVESFLDPESAEWKELAMRQYQKKYTNPQVSNYNEWSKRARFLQGRGFTSTQIRATVFFNAEELD